MISSYSPQRPSDLVVEVAESSRAEVEAQATRARPAQRAWWEGPAASRAQALTAAADAVAAASGELADLVVREVGKPLGESRGEVARTVAILRYYAQQVFDPVGAVHEPSAEGLLFTRRHPLGVAGLITPWNFPLAIPIWKAAPALAFGNAVLLKPAPEATACALRLAELLAPVLPEDLFAVLPGDAETGSAVVDCADVVSFTGSSAAGRIVLATAGKRGVPVQAEMGGQNPALVLPDADVASAAGQIAAAAMGYAGQKCTATKRVIVVGDPDAFREAFIAHVESLKAGDPAEQGVTVGPVINEAARSAVIAASDDAKRSGGTILTGGAVGLEDGSGDGWYVAPTVVEGVAPDHQLACEEVFGPICLLQSAANLDHGIEMANSVPHGLAAAVYTSDIGAALAASERLHAGMVKVNAPTSGVDFYLPFGGEKASSAGAREQGKAAQEFYTSIRTITIAAAGR